MKRVLVWGVFVLLAACGSMTEPVQPKPSSEITAKMAGVYNLVNYDGHVIPGSWKITNEGGVELTVFVSSGTLTISSAEHKYTTESVVYSQLADGRLVLEVGTFNASGILVGQTPVLQVVSATGIGENCPLPGARITVKDPNGIVATYKLR